MLQKLILAISPFSLILLYCSWNDRRLRQAPLEALSTERLTPEGVHKLKKRLDQSPPLSTAEVIPPKTGRRYIIVGGGGFLGGWIATKLLERGESLDCIRLLDINPPVKHPILLRAIQNGLQFLKVDVLDAIALEAAFNMPWPNTCTDTKLTVFHTAAVIRFYESHPMFLERSTRVNVDGTKNSLEAARSAGAAVFIFTSSASVGMHANRLLLWPWEAGLKKPVQIFNDDDSLLPKRHQDFFANYAVSKVNAERLVAGADRSMTPSGSVMRTGCIRPGNAIFGPRGDSLCGNYLIRRNNPTWSTPIIQSFIYVENAVLAHLNFEQRVIEMASGNFPNRPDIGGQSFAISDPGTSVSFGDLYVALITLSEGECQFPHWSPTFMLLVGHLVQQYCLAHHRLQLLRKSKWGGVASFVSKLMPSVQSMGELAWVQPSLFYMTCVHFLIDDSRARLSPEAGGLGYTGLWTTLEGVYETFKEHQTTKGQVKLRSNYESDV